MAKQTKDSWVYKKREDMTDSELFREATYYRWIGWEEHAREFLVEICLRIETPKHYVKDMA